LPPTAPPTPLPPGISLSPLAIDFGLVTVGQTATIPVVLTNGGPDPILLDNLAGGAPNDPTAFGGSQNCAGITLAVLGTCEFSYTFTPPGVGKYTSATTIGVGDDDYAIQFTGCGVELAIPEECLGGVQQ
jgi:hypothetical protein